MKRTTWLLLGCMGASSCSPRAKVQAAGDGTPANTPQLPSTPLAKGGPARNLFVEAGYDEQDVNEKLATAYASLFHGNPNNQAIFYSAGSNDNGPLAYILDVGNGDVRSEGMSYGMWLALQFDRKDDFDALWNWARSHMYHDDLRHPAYGYFSWQMRTDGTPIDEMPAPDGEEYFAMSLLMAHNRWGDGDGIFDYDEEGRRILHDMVHRVEIEGPCQACKNPKPKATSLFNVQERQVRFTPDMAHFETNADHTDPSYHLPAFYELFAEWGPDEDAEFWREAASTSRRMFSKFAHPTTGLYPDYARFDGTPFAVSWDPGTVNFRFDAWRVAMNVAVDWAWWGVDRTEVELLSRLQSFFAKEGIKMYGNQYALDGKKLSSDRSSGLIAMNGVASIATEHEAAYDFVREVYKMPVPQGQWRYYDGCLYLMSLSYISGHSRIHWPEASSGR